MKKQAAALPLYLLFLSRNIADVHSLSCRQSKISTGDDGERDKSRTGRGIFGRASLASSREFLRTAVVASALLLCHPLSAAADANDAASPTSSASIPAPPAAGSMGTSIVFDAMDDVPPIEEAVARGSATTVLKLREVADERCKIQSSFGDVLEIEYVAKRLAPPAAVYDASVFRGTGQPFKFVLGSGVMIPGVDTGLYGMCPGEVRLLKVPPKLAAGLLDPPAKAPLEWRVELVSIGGMIREGNNDELTREDRNMEVD